MPRPLRLLAPVLLLTLLLAPAASGQTQLGADIDGEAAFDLSGVSVSLDGDRLAIGAPNNNGGNGVDSGHTRVYQWDGSAWAQLGLDIDGEAAGDQSGTSVSLDGDRLAIGATQNDGNGVDSGHTRVYQWDATANGGAGAWAQLGLDIDGEAAFDLSGVSVSLDGDRLAIGAPDNNGGNGVDSGHTRVYQWDGSAWAQLGLDIDGEAAGDQSGTSVSLDGDRLAIGATQNDGNGVDSGHTRVYQWDATANGGAGAWAQLGTDIDGEAAGDQSGSSVSLNGDRLAIGAISNDGNGVDSGHTRVYQWDGSAWAQLGLDIDGEAANDASGYSVSLSGDRLAIGAVSNGGNGGFSGHTRVVEWNGSAWTRFGVDIDGEAADDRFGSSVSLDGDRLAIGASNNAANGFASGHTRVFTFAPQPVASVTLDGDEGWRMLASPEATTVGDFLDQFWTQGFTGADDPGGDCTVYTYDEAAASFTLGWTCVDDADDALLRGQGVMVFIFRDDDLTTPGTIDDDFPKTLSASAAIAPTGDFAFTVAFTDDARILGQKGWTLLGAPFGTSFDWAAMTRSGVGPTAYVYDPALGTSGGYRTYTLDATGDFGDLTGGIIPSFQGFFVKAHAAAPTLTLPEAGAEDGQDVYGRVVPTEPPLPPPAPVQSVSVATADEGGAPLATALRAVVPNPSSGRATVTWALAEAGAARLTVVDLLGREVAVLAEGSFAAGSHRAEVAAGRLAPGVYVVRLAAGSVVEAVRFTVVR